MIRNKLPVVAALGLMLVAAVSADDFGRVVDALTSGAAARGKAERVRAGRVLLAVGARALDGDDLATGWAGNRTLPYRDRALGPAYRTVVVKSGGTAHFEQTFLGGQRAQIAIVAIDRAPFTLAVKDDEGALSCAAPPGGRCAWMPLWTTRYGIDVRNPGRATGRYYMVVQ